ncbi:MAG: hypothetical protein LBS14_03405 [Holosporaceae bacterium]|jgi:chromosomal replication initiation ATPase DnaA|nr:hypothetical protein [Holosporaceae bacterium]
MMQQEIFDFCQKERLNWKDFVESDENRAALMLLAQWPEWNGNGLIIYGEACSGKTHLAALWAQTANAVYVLKGSMDGNPRDLFETVGNSKCNFIIDNFDELLIPKNYDRLFHFLNILREKNRFLLLLSRLHPQLWDITLEDLKSRLLSIPIVGIESPGDDLLLRIARKIARDLGITIENDALGYLLNTLERRVTSLASALKILDKLSLRQKKSLSPAFVKKNLQQLF